MPAEGTRRYVPTVDPAGALERFGRLIDGDPALVPLDRAALAIEDVLRGGVDEAPALDLLDTLAAGCGERSFEGLRHHLFDEVGFAGDSQRYDDPENSFLQPVLARRRGLPILLATVMIEVGRRAGVGVVGIGMPMHFLVRDATDPTALVDPFTGAMLDPEGARAMFESMARGTLAWDDRHLEPVPARAIVVRILSNLRASYRRRRDPVHAALVAGLRWRVPELSAERADAARSVAVFN